MQTATLLFQNSFKTQCECDIWAEKETTKPIGRENSNQSTQPTNFINPMFQRIHQLRSINIQRTFEIERTKYIELTKEHEHKHFKQ